MDQNDLIREYKRLWKWADQVDKQMDMLEELGGMIDARMAKIEPQVPDIDRLIADLMKAEAPRRD